MRIGFLVGDLVHIGGGSNVIAEYAFELGQLGHEVLIVQTQEGDVQGASWHPKLRHLRTARLHEVRELPFDFVFATWWVTFFQLHRLRSRVYGYLNQSLESRFHAERHMKLLNRATYGVPLLVVTEAAWLAEFVRLVQPDSRVVHVRNGLSPEYFPCVAAPPIHGAPLRVLVEGPWPVPHKGVPETFQLLERAHASGVEMRVGWLTSDTAGATPEVGGAPVQIHACIPIDEVRDVLRRYDVLVKLSRVEGVFGPPLEMFSQGGTAITLTVTGSDDYLVHGYNGLLVEPYNTAQVVRYLALLRQSPEYLLHLRKNALRTAEQQPGWSQSAALLSRALEGMLEEGWTNEHVRPALATLSSLESWYVGERGRLEREWQKIAAMAAATARPAALLERIARLKQSGAYRGLKWVIPQSVRSRLRSLIDRVLE